MWWWWWVCNREGGGQGQTQHGVAQRRVVQVARVVVLVVVGRVLRVLVFIGLGLVLVLAPDTLRHPKAARTWGTTHAFSSGQVCVVVVVVVVVVV